MRVIDLVIDSNSERIYFLPYDCEESIFLSLSRDALNYTRLEYRERDWIERVTGPVFSLPGNLPWYYRGENLAWSYNDPGIFTFTTNTPDAFTVYIEGMDATGYPINETFILNATVPPTGPVIPGSVATANSYARVTSLSKTGGILKIDAGGQTVVLPAARNEIIFSQFVLYPPPIFTNTDGSNSPVYARLQVKLKADSLDNDMSVPRVSHITSALIEFTLASLYTRTHQLTKADARERKAIQHIQAAVQVEKNQSENRQQVIPVIYDAGDYLGAGAGVSSSFPFG